METIDAYHVRTYSMCLLLNLMLVCPPIGPPFTLLSVEEK